MRSFATMQHSNPDFFIHCGDSIYADCPLQTELTLPGGGVWKNVVTEEKSRIAETLADYRGNYKYNLLDQNVRAFNAEVPTFALWDDHEVTNDWWPGEMRSDFSPRRRFCWRRAHDKAITLRPAVAGSSSDTSRSTALQRR